VARTFARIARLVLAVALCGAVSGVPATVAAAFEGHGCAECDAPLEVGRCPPNCDVGPCAKVFPSLASSAIRVALPRDAREGIDLSAARPPLTPLARGVFHPPRG
jgi:hypothetical protein